MMPLSLRAFGAALKIVRSGEHSVASHCECETRYSTKALGAWAKILKSWMKTHDVFAVFVAGAKERDPAAA